jgi:DNA (cytosine-5)-methyltransferase 1
MNYCIGNGQVVQTGLHKKVGTLNCMHDQQAILVGGGTEMETVVRRLTPLECERLQGFPDGWTDIGEWTDSKGKKHKDADSPRYKALGNSIAVPFWFYILRRIAAQYERPATLGSLFDGIGGFPYCWEKCNGKGTAVWASEIEEFPIEVTKIRFPEEDEDEQKTN